MFLGIDLGTSSVKLILIDDKQQIIATTSSPLTVSRPQPLWSEQDPEHWWQATENAYQQLHKQQASALKQLRAIGLSGQMHGATLIDKHHRVLRPAILWNDGRSFSECELIRQRVPDAEQITGNLLFPGFTAPKLLWIQQHEAEIFKAIYKVLLPKDYIRLQLTGEYATDLSDASGTSWLDVGNRCWSTVMLDATELNESHMPQLFEGNAITGTVKADLAQRWQIPATTAVVGGGGDNAASAISMNVIEPGQAFLSLGTSGVYFTADNCYRPNPAAAIHTMCHCLPNRWHEMNVYLSAASSVSWYADQIAHENIADLLAAAESNHQLDAPLFLPHLSGERTPYNNPHAKAVFFGMTHRTQQSTLMQSVLEGVALLIAQGQQALAEVGVDADTINVVGGGAESPYWGRILASALNKTLIYRDAAHLGGAFGAAKLAWLAIHGGEPQNVLTLPPIQHTIAPVAAWVDHYATKLTTFKKLYHACEPLF